MKKNKALKQIFDGPVSSFLWPFVFFFMGYLVAVAPPWETQAFAYCPEESTIPCVNPFVQCKQEQIFKAPECEFLPECEGENCDAFYLNAGDYAGKRPPEVVRKANLIILAAFSLMFGGNSLIYLWRNKKNEIQNNSFIRGSRAKTSEENGGENELGREKISPLFQGGKGPVHISVSRPVGTLGQSRARARNGINDKKQSEN